jgi:hypothetical protein
MVDPGRQNYPRNMTSLLWHPENHSMNIAATATTRDSQLTELVGRHFLIAQLVAADLEVAIPVRDRGIDLIAYLDLTTETKQFISCPIQMKASREARFGADKKYEKIANLLIAYVWHIDDPVNACVYALTYQEAVGLLEKRGHTETSSWIDKGGYTVPNPSESWLEDLKPYKMTPDCWRDRIRSAATL